MEAEAAAVADVGIAADVAGEGVAVDAVGRSPTSTNCLPTSGKCRGSVAEGGRLRALRRRRPRLEATFLIWWASNS